MPKWLKILLTIVAVIVGLILTLFIISKIFNFESLGAMLQHIGWYLGFIWTERLT